jgi:hypothetical protein
MNVADTCLASPAAPSVAPLSPQRAALAEAIGRFLSARQRLEHAQNGLVTLERPPASVSSRNAGELCADMTRLHEITRWLGARSGDARPSLAGELKEAESWLGEVAGVAATAEQRLSAAERGYVDAAPAAREAHHARDCAVWATAVDAAGPALRRLERTVAAVYERDARLRSLIVALREIGNRNTEENRGALAAAEAIERALNLARRQTPRNADPRGARSLIERLQTDPLATL